MECIRLSDNDLNIMQRLAPKLGYNAKKNIIHGVLSFDLQYEENGEKIKDEYQIEIDLNYTYQGMPIVRETGKRIQNIAFQKRLPLVDLHINNDNEMCMIIPPLIKEKYPNGFDMEILINHIQEHLYSISFFEKNNIWPWKPFGHGDEGYLELYLEDKERYSEVVKKYFKCNTRPDFRRKLKELRRKYKK